jgi:hypothetical protein
MFKKEFSPSSDEVNAISDAILHEKTNVFLLALYIFANCIFFPVAIFGGALLL